MSMKLIDPVPDLIWQPLLEAAAQTIAGMIGAYAVKHIVQRIFKKNYFMGSQDLWFRGIMGKQVDEGDRVIVEGMVSTFTQVFPGNPFENAKRWSSIYRVEGKLDSQDFQSLDFVAGSDAALRIGSFNGETLLGIYNQYGYLGEGIVGVISTSMLKKVFPNFRDPNFIGSRALVGGRLKKCPAQHAFVIEALCRKCGLKIDTSGYKKMVYIDIDQIEPFTGAKNIFTLLGSPWAVTLSNQNQYIIRYAHLSDPAEKKDSIDDMRRDRAWKKARIFYDDLEAPSDDLRFSKAFF